MYSVRVPRKHRRVGRTVFPALLLVLLIGALTFNMLRPLPPAEAETVGTSSNVSAVTLKWPSSGSAALGAQSFGVLDAYGSIGPRPIASLTKLVTALAIIEQKPFSLGEQGETYTFTKHDVELYDSYKAQGASTIKVSEGQQMTEYQMLQAMLLPSANNIADSGALWAFGSTDAFLAYARGMTGRLGMKQTSIADASGLSAKNVATTRELILLGQQVLSQPVLANIVSQPAATLPGNIAISNTNALLGHDNIIGIKVGLSEEAGGCLLFAAGHKLATGENITIIGAIIGAKTLQDAFNEAPTMIDSAKPYFTVKTVVQKGQKVATYHAAWGAQTDAIATKDIELVSWQGLPLTSKIKLDQPSRARETDSVVGTYMVYSGKNGKGSPIALKSTLSAPPLTWRLKRLD